MSYKIGKKLHIIVDDLNHVKCAEETPLSPHRKLPSVTEHTLFNEELGNAVPYFVLHVYNMLYIELRKCQTGAVCSLVFKEVEGGEF